MKKPIYYVLIGVLLLVFCFSAFQIANYFIKGREKANQFDELSQLASQATSAPTTAPTTAATTEPTTEATTEATTEPTEPTMIPGYADVYARNNDVIGWIKIDGTKIDYPVMQTPNEPNYYLKRDFDKNYSEWGCLYVREECDVNTPSDTVTIYGHTMKDGSMFAALHNYTQESFYKDHKLIYFDTLTEYHVYEIFAVFKTSANLGEGFRYHIMENAKDEKEFNDYVAECKKLAFYDTGITPVYGDKLILLSTCEYTLPGNNGRLVVAARRVF